MTNYINRLERLEAKHKPDDRIKVLYSDGSVRRMSMIDAFVEILNGRAPELFDDDPPFMEEDGELVYMPAHTIDDAPRAVDVLECKSNFIDALLGRAPGADVP